MKFIISMIIAAVSLAVIGNNQEKCLSALKASSSLIPSDDLTVVRDICQFAFENDEACISNILHKMSSDRYQELIFAANLTEMAMFETTNADDIAKCRLLKSAVLVECAEIELEDTLYDSATSLCITEKINYANRKEESKYRDVNSILDGI